MLNLLVHLHNQSRIRPKLPIVTLPELSAKAKLLSDCHLIHTLSTEETAPSKNEKFRSLSLLLELVFFYVFFRACAHIIKVGAAPMCDRPDQGGEMCHNENIIQLHHKCLNKIECAPNSRNR